MTTQNTFSLLGRAEGTHPNDDYAEPCWKFDLSGGNRKNLAETLTNFFKQSSTPYVVAVHGECGTGKTFFLKAWKNWLLEQPFNVKATDKNSQSEEKGNGIGLPCFYFNAWEVDYSEDALLAFSYSIIEQIEEQKKNTDGYLSRVKEAIVSGATTAMKNAPATIGALTTIGIKAGLRWLKVDPNEVVDALVQDTTDAIANKIQDTFEKTQDARQAVKENIKDFAKACYDETGSPIIIMVDELDRCKPSFAIELLENIKHLFSVPHVIFILALEENQLANCISSVYGLDTVGAKRYLGRFIDMQVRLPEIDIAQYVKSYANINTCKFLANSFHANYIVDTQNVGECTVAKSLSVIFSSLNLSLRDIHQVLSRLAVINITQPTNLYLILCGKALARLQRGDTLDNIALFGELPAHIQVNRDIQDIQERYLVEAIRQIEEEIKNAVDYSSLNNAIKSEIDRCIEVKRKYLYYFKLSLVEAGYNRIIYTYKSSSIYDRQTLIRDHYKKCIIRDLSTVSGIDFTFQQDE
ncbi:KAP family P-loop NTPase fold protein [Desulfovibrio litoralis]|uniref:KAP family P-loop domain-containing protein n=1 Tax=Desulfovibrio litoralis DSM 11393 TaxID=1121455 RepID=A0A1M7SYK3_9BACT|nr:P-loop NTPase fold protein [Desulfovibrio litoralis]SHN63481.1 KAP family P-loop domain-containing protein [Desulfovibrio litoralis DSM 11393]